MKLKLSLAALVLVVAPVGFAGEPNAKIADVIAQIEARRNDKEAAEGKAAANREENGGWGNWTGGGGNRGQGGGGMNRKRGGQNNNENKDK